MLTRAQIAALRLIGVDIGQAWAGFARASGFEPGLDYDFRCDLAYIRGRAREAGIAWSGDRPDDDAEEVWAAIREGYLAAIQGS